MVDRMKMKPSTKKRKRGEFAWPPTAAQTCLICGSSPTTFRRGDFPGEAMCRQCGAPYQLEGGTAELAAKGIYPHLNIESEFVPICREYWDATHEFVCYCIVAGDRPGLKRFLAWLNVNHPEVLLPGGKRREGIDVTRQFCCYIDPTQDPDVHGGFVPSLVFADEPGHRPLIGQGDGSAPWVWGKTLKEAERVCRYHNETRLGLSPTDVDRIIDQSVSMSIGDTRYKTAATSVVTKKEGGDLNENEDPVAGADR